MRFPLTSDSFNPMLVRDLRQGLRSRRFTAAFLLLQGTLAFFVILGLLATSTETLIGYLNGVLWVGMYLFYILGLPLAAANSFTPEYRENRLDLLKLTQMQARGLVWGKWWSFFSQGALVAVSLLPYIVLTYFVGGVELTSELEQIAILFGVSSLLVALALAVSSVNFAAVRVLLVGGMLFFGMTAMGGIVPLVSMAGMAGSDEAMLLAILLLLFAGIPALILMLETGSVRLAPSAENHDTPQRLVLLALSALNLVVAGLAFWYGSPFWRNLTQALFFCSGLQMFWVFLFASASEPLPFPDVYRPFVRRGTLGVYVGRLLLYPGWPTALPFILIFDAALYFLGHPLLKFAGAAGDVLDLFATFCLFLPPAFLFPSVASTLLSRTRFSYPVRYFAMGLASVIVLGVFACFSNVMESPALMILPCVLPPCAWMLLGFGAIEPQYVGVAQLVGAGGSLLVLLFALSRMSRHWSQFRELERRARNTPPVPAPAVRHSPLPPQSPG